MVHNLDKVRNLLRPIILRAAVKPILTGHQDLLVLAEEIITVQEVLVVELPVAQDIRAMAVVLQVVAAGTGQVDQADFILPMRVVAVVAVDIEVVAAVAVM